MNILYISSKKRWGGVVSWMVKTAIGLDQKGHNVFILSHPNSKLNKLENKPNIHLIEKKLGPVYNPFMILYLTRFIKKNKIDLVVTNIDKEVAIGGIAAKICGIPNIRRVGSDKDFNNRFRMKRNHILFTNKSIVPCNYLSKTITEKYSYTNIKDFTTIYNGRNKQEIDTNKIAELKKTWNVNDNEKVMGITGQLTMVKHIDDLIKVFSKIVKKHGNWKLVITGEGPEKKNLQDLVQELNIVNNVVFAGFSDDPILSASCYDIAMLTSHREGFPNSIVEYMSTGKPVISTDVGGVNEIITDMENGLLVPYGNLDFMEETILKLITDESLQEKISKKAKITIEESFTEDIMITHLESFFKEQIK